MKARKLFDLPIPQSGCGDTRLLSDGVKLSIEFEYRKDRKDLIGVLQFEGVVAYRFRDEGHAEGYCSEAYESLAEIGDSDWASQLECKVRHFAAFLSSNGYFEILASDCILGPTREGLLG